MCTIIEESKRPEDLKKPERYTVESGPKDKIWVKIAEMVHI